MFNHSIAVRVKNYALNLHKYGFRLGETLIKNEVYMVSSIKNGELDLAFLFKL